LKILRIHNSYQIGGGEDVVFQQERQLLEGQGHQVFEYLRHNDEILDHGFWRRAILPVRAVWARDSCRELSTLLSEHKPDIAHFHNTFPLISPAAYYACRRAAVPVVQTLHNFRLLCPAAIFYRDGQVCEECSEHGTWRGLLHGCYRQSRAATAGVAVMLEAHRWLGTWAGMVHRYVALTEFARRKFIAGGLPAARVVTKPNFIHPDPGARSGGGRYALFVGRLSPEKGLDVLLAAWKLLKSRIPLVIVGDGPLRAGLEGLTSRLGLNNIFFRGRLSHAETVPVVLGARCLILPTLCFENFPMSIVEAYACAVPAICSRLGAMAEIVDDGRTGLHFTAGNADDLAQKVAWAWAHPEPMVAMGREARREFETRYTVERNYPLLMEIYESAIASNK
jgi:glycosyltransferase involved in cell wall biosynthesis